jgi:hypothetical protein
MRRVTAFLALALAIPLLRPTEMTCAFFGRFDNPVEHAVILL